MNRFIYIILVGCMFAQNAFSQVSVRQEFLSKDDYFRLHEEAQSSTFKTFVGENKTTVGTVTLGSGLAIVLASHAYFKLQQLMPLTYTERYCLRNPKSCYKILEKFLHLQPHSNPRVVFIEKFPGITALAKELNFSISIRNNPSGEGFLIELVNTNRRDLVDAFTFLPEHSDKYKYDVFAQIRMDMDKGFGFLNEFSSVPRKNLKAAREKLFSLYRFSMSGPLNEVTRNYNLLPSYKHDPQKLGWTKYRISEAYKLAEEYKMANFTVSNITSPKHFNIANYRSRNPLVTKLRNFQYPKPKHLPLQKSGVALKRLSAAGAIIAGAVWLASETMEEEKEIIDIAALNMLIHAEESDDQPMMDMILNDLPLVVEEASILLKEYEAFVELTK